MDNDTVPTDVALAAQSRALAEALRQHRKVMATAESCTGGWIAKLCTDIPGSSTWFQGGAVTYSDGLKQALLGVTAATLERHGAVSRECALEMVQGALVRLASDVAVAVTGIAGPDGGSADKPVGTVWIAWSAHDRDARAQVFQFRGDRDAVRRRTIAAALAGIREILTA